MLVLNVPLQERNEAGVPDHEVRELLRRGAAGEFDHHFRALAERLVRLKVPDTILVLGWEMNGVTYTHRVRTGPSGLEDVLEQDRHHHARGAGPEVPVRLHAEPRLGRRALDPVLPGRRHGRRHRHGLLRPACRNVL
ncbi:hypothetical protein SHIRM173S_12058 [Streptomyces hirsutus]